jgi:hypothetical protein
MSDPGTMGDSGFERSLRDNVRRLDEQVGYVQDLLSEKINHLRSEVQGNDKRYDQRFNAQESANKYAQEKQNEFRGALEDVGKNQMPRAEAEREFRALREQVASETASVRELHVSGVKAANEKIDDLRARLDRTEGRGTMVDPLVAQLARDVAALTASRDQSGGEKIGRLSQQQVVMMIVSLIVSLIVIGSVVVAIAYGIKR